MSAAAARLLDLTIEYREARDNAHYMSAMGETPAGRSAEEIAAEYDEALRSFLSQPE